MSLRDMMKRHATGIWVRPDHHGEACTIYPQDGSGPFTVNVVVDRYGLEDVASFEGSGVRRVATVFIPNTTDTAAGVAAIAKGDELEFPIELGGAAVRCRILEVVDADVAGFTVRAGK